jgi:integrase
VVYACAVVGQFLVQHADVGGDLAILSKGKHPKIVQSWLGHSSITQTMDRYSHLLVDIGGDAVEGLDESFG